MDMLSLLRQYAQKHEIYEIRYEDFLEYLKHTILLYSDKNPDLANLRSNTAGKLIASLYSLSEAKKISLETSSSGIEKIIFPEFYTNQVAQEYRRMDEAPDIPFPSAESLGLELPPAWVNAIALDDNFIKVCATPPDELPPLFILNVGTGLESIIIRKEQLKDDLLIQAVLKIRQYLRMESNLEFTRRKLLSAFQTKEALLKDTLNIVQTRPFDAAKQISDARGDFTFPFWAYLLSHVRQDLAKRGDLTPLDKAIMQSVAIVEYFNNYYKGLTQRNLELETAFKNFDLAIRKPPYCFQYDDLVNFSDSSGKPLLGRFSKESLDNYLRGKMTPASDGDLPEILAFQTATEQRYYMAVERLGSLTSRLGAECRLALRTQLIDHWSKALMAFETLPSMNDDDEYRKELAARMGKSSPILAALINNGILEFVFANLDERNALPGDFKRIFQHGKIVPLEEFFSLPRKGVLTDSRMLLPIWYSIPIFSHIMKFLKRLEKNKQAKTTRETGQKKKPETVPPSTRERWAELRDAAIRVEASIMPKNYKDLDDYLMDLESKWNTLLDAEAKHNLTVDVNSLIRDYLRHVLRTMHGASFTQSRVEEMAENVAHTPALLRIKNER
jgi:hypothetical protein